MQTTTLIAWYKGTAGEFNKLQGLAPMLMTQAAQMRKSLSPFRVIEVKHLAEEEELEVLGDMQADRDAEELAADNED